MTRRIRIINEFARSLDAREGNRQITVGSLRTGDVLSSTGEKVIAINRNYTLVGLMLSKGGYGRPVTWDAKAKISVVGRDASTPKSFWSYQAGSETPSLEEAIRIGAIGANTTQEKWDQLSPGMKREIVRSKNKNKDGVGTPEEIAYGEGWHSTENVNPYTSATEKAAWEKGRAAKKLKFKSNTNARRGEVRGRSFQPPKQKIADSDAVRIIRVPAGGLAVVTPDGKEFRSKTVMGARTIAEREATRCGCMIHNEITGSKFYPDGPVAQDFRSEKGYVAKIIDVKTGGVLARSEPHISNGVGLKNWIQTEALKLIRQGKRVKAEVGVEFFDPDRMDDSQDTEKVNIVYRKNWRIMSYEPSPGVVRFAVYEGSDMKGKENNIQTLGAAKRYVDYLAKGGY